MDDKLKKMLSRVDHTLLGQAATESDFRALCDEAAQYKVASVCVPPARVEFCVDYLEGRIPVCTVVGFPNGYMLGSVKAYESAQAISQGAEEIDMVINIGYVKDGDYNGVLSDIDAVRKSTDGRLLKVIIETSMLTEEEKIKMRNERVGS